MTTHYSKSEQMIRAAWMYYVLGKNQNDIASELGVSRPVVQRLISAAKEEGYITVGVHHPIATCLDYATRLCEKFALRDCVVVPGYNGGINGENTDVTDSIAFGGGQILSKYINQLRVKSIGIGSGTTLQKSVNRLTASQPCQTRCISLISAIGTSGQCNYYDDVPLILASKIKAPYYQFAVPRYACNQVDLHSWQSHQLYQQLTEFADACDALLIGIGDLGPDSPIVHDGFISANDHANLIECGCVGEILGRFIDAEGQVLDHPLNQRITSYDIRRNPNIRIAIAGDTHKRTPILGALNGRWINGLVTDEDTARWLLTR